MGNKIKRLVEVLIPAKDARGKRIPIVYPCYVMHNGKYLERNGKTFGDDRKKALVIHSKSLAKKVAVACKDKVKVVMMTKEEYEEFRKEIAERKFNPEPVEITESGQVPIIPAKPGALSYEDVNEPTKPQEDVK